MTLLDALARRWTRVDRERLLAAVLVGGVTVDGEAVRDPRRSVGSAAELRIDLPVPGLRGGRKLDGALDSLGLDVAGIRVLDAGSASGGFCDSLLRHGAAEVVCVDVAYGALAYRLRQDPRTVVMERVNVMQLTGARLAPLPDLAVCDLSFRSLRGAASHLLELTSRGLVLALAKPQFEWFDAPAEFDGVVAGGATVADILEQLITDLSDEGVAVAAAVESVVRGRRGNREIFLLLVESGGRRDTFSVHIERANALQPGSLLQRLRADAPLLPDLSS